MARCCPVYGAAAARMPSIDPTEQAIGRTGTSSAPWTSIELPHLRSPPAHETRRRKPKTWRIARMPTISRLGGLAFLVVEPLPLGVAEARDIG
jgi:hypothetical protein